MKDKIKIPSKEEKRIDVLESENAALWFENITVKSDLESAKQEIADLWFHNITGGVQ